MTTVDDQLGLSPQFRNRALARIPGGVNSNVRLTGPCDRYIQHGSGAWLYDVDGNDYVDYLLGQGPNILGHAPKLLSDAVAQACRSGLIFGGQHPLEVRAAEILCEVLRWPDMVRLAMTGSEAVQAALRLARAATGRRKWIRFEGHYHGWFDNVLTADLGGEWGPASGGQVADYLEDSVILPWNDAGVLAEALEREEGEIAAVIMEPVMLNAGSIEPAPGYLESVRRLCSRHGVVLIFDEVIYGFRACLGGAAERYGVVPDLGIYGKALGGGHAVAALAGPAELMRRFGTREVTHAGTFNGSVPATAAIVATLNLLRDDPPYARMAEHGTALMKGLREVGRTYGVPLHVQGLPMAFHVSLGEADVTDYRSLQRLDLAGYADLANSLVENGIWVAPRGIWYVSAAHGPRELDAALTRFDAALRRWV